MPRGLQPSRFCTTCICLIEVAAAGAVPEPRFPVAAHRTSAYIFHAQWVHEPTALELTSMHRLAHRGILFCALLLLAACGGGSKTSGSDAAVGGSWTGTLTVNGIAYDAQALSSESGELELLETDSTSSFQAQYWGMINAAGQQLSGSFSGAVLNQAEPFSDGSLRGTGTVSGTIHQHSSITATLSFTTALGAAVPGQLSLTYDPAYDQGSSLTTIAGN